MFHVLFSKCASCSVSGSVSPSPSLLRDAPEQTVVVRTVPQERSGNLRHILPRRRGLHRLTTSSPPQRSRQQGTFVADGSAIGLVYKHTDFVCEGRQLLGQLMAALGTFTSGTKYAVSGGKIYAAIRSLKRPTLP